MIRSNLNFEKYIQAGLDIGTNKICCAISEIDAKTDTVKLLGIGNSNATSINKGAITHRDNLIDEIEHAVDEAKTMSGVNLENVALGISGEHIRGINTQGAIAVGGSQTSNVQTQNEITPSDVKKVLDLAKAISLPMDRDILHVLPQEYVIDTMNSIQDPVGLLLVLAGASNDENFWKDPRQGQTRWDGSVCDQLILWDDQGFGDTLQNLSWITEAASRVGRLRIWLRPALLSLVSACFPLPANCQLEVLDPLEYVGSNVGLVNEQKTEQRYHCQASQKCTNSKPETRHLKQYTAAQGSTP